MIRVAVATSGGRDSTALLHATLRALRVTRAEVHALHVHHGLQAEADAWLVQVRRQARRWGAGFDFRRIEGTPAAGQSVEAWARLQRYAALATMADELGCGMVLLAHHRRDQAETWLLQALRGGGAAGLSSMPDVAQRGGIVWARPWLCQPRAAIEAYVRRFGIRYVDDPSNGDPRFARNRLRLQLWPVLTQAFPDAESSLVAAAAHAQSAAALAREVLTMDLPGLVARGGLDVPAWLKLPPARRRNALSGWLGQQLGRGAPDSLVERLCSELPRCRTACWSAPGGTVRLYRGQLRVDPRELASASAATGQRRADEAIDLSAPGVYFMPNWGGSWIVEYAQGTGLLPATLATACMRPRTGGERFRLAPTAPARSLKKQYQAVGVPAWDRHGPLLFDNNGELIFAPGLGVNASVRKAQDPAGLHLSWIPVGAAGRIPSSDPG